MQSTYIGKIGKILSVAFSTTAVCLLLLIPTVQAGQLRSDIIKTYKLLKEVSAQTKQLATDYDSKTPDAREAVVETAKYVAATYSYCNKKYGEERRNQKISDLGNPKVRRSLKVISNGMEKAIQLSEDWRDVSADNLRLRAELDKLDNTIDDLRGQVATRKIGVKDRGQVSV